MKVDFKFNMRDEVIEVIDGFKGVIIAMAAYDTGCRHYGIKPKKLKADGSMQDWAWIDETRLKLVKAANYKVEVERSGPSCNPPMN